MAFKLKSKNKPAAVKPPKNKKVPAAATDIVSASADRGASGGVATASVPVESAKEKLRDVSADVAAASTAGAQAASVAPAKTTAATKRDADKPAPTLPAASEPQKNTFEDLSRTLATTVNTTVGAVGGQNPVSLQQAQQALLGGGVAPAADGQTLDIPVDAVPSAMRRLGELAAITDPSTLAMQAAEVQSSLGAERSAQYEAFVMETARAAAYLAAYEAQCGANRRGWAQNGLGSARLFPTPLKTSLYRAVANGQIMAALKHGLLDEAYNRLGSPELAVAFVRGIEGALPEAVADALRSHASTGYAS